MSKKYYLDAIKEYCASEINGPPEDYVFKDKDAAEKKAAEMGLNGVHSHETEDGETMWMPGKNMKEFKDWYDTHRADGPYHKKMM